MTSKHYFSTTGIEKLAGISDIPSWIDRKWNEAGGPEFVEDAVDYAKSLNPWAAPRRTTHPVTHSYYGNMDNVTTPQYKQYQQGMEQGGKALQDALKQVRRGKYDPLNRYNRLVDLENTTASKLETITAIRNDGNGPYLQKSTWNNAPSFVAPSSSSLVGFSPRTASGWMSALDRASVVKKFLREQKVQLDNSGTTLNDVSGGAKSTGRYPNLKIDPYIRTMPNIPAGILAHEWGHVLEMKRKGVFSPYDSSLPEEDHPLFRWGSARTNNDKNIIDELTATPTKKEHLATDLYGLMRNKEVNGIYGYPTGKNGEVHPDALEWQGRSDYLNAVRRRAIHALQEHPTIKQELKASFDGLQDIEKHLPGLLTKQDRISAYAGIPTYQATYAPYLTPQEVREVAGDMINHPGKKVMDIAPPSVYESMEDASRTRMQHFDPRRAKWNPRRSVNI